jgi:predicted phosphodiesterase
MKYWLLGTDRHHIATEPFHPSYLLFKEFAKATRPDGIADLGDTLDLPYFSDFSREDIPVQASADWEDDVDLLNREWDELQKYCAEIVWVLGNHDWRAYKQGLKTPKFASSLNYRRRFHVKDRPMKMLTVEEAPAKIGKLHLLHGWYHNQYHCRKHLDVYSGNVVYGHVHKQQSFSKDLPAERKSIQAWSLGCLCDKQPDYLKGKPSNWQNGFAVAYFDDKGNFNLYPINIVGNSFIWEGREWSLKELKKSTEKSRS